MHNQPLFISSKGHRGYKGSVCQILSKPDILGWKVGFQFSSQSSEPP